MKTKTQNYSNHSQVVPLYHFVTFFAILLLLAGAIIYLFQGNNKSQLFPWLFLLMVLTLFSITMHNRSFALRAQDRAIRAEENLRYFILTGKRLSPNIRMGQIIALRFASDDEFVELVEKTLRENLRSRDIKKVVKNWRPDYHRA
jgi:cbb3-type cytochrome oxidase subunit 3